MKRIIIFISGRGSNMEAILENVETGVLNGVCSVKAVFSNKLKAEGLSIAAEHGIPTLVINSKSITRAEYDEELLDLMEDLNPDYIVLAGYMRILAPEFVRRFEKRIINIHPADTSQHQGLHAYEWAFEQGLDETKITVHFVDEGVDTGEIIGQKTVNISGAASLQDVEARGLAVEHEFYSEMLNKVFSQH